MTQWIEEQPMNASFKQLMLFGNHVLECTICWADRIMTPSEHMARLLLCRLAQRSTEPMSRRIDTVSSFLENKNEVTTVLVASPNSSRKNIPHDVIVSVSYHSQQYEVIVWPPAVDASLFRPISDSTSRRRTRLRKMWTFQEKNHSLVPILLYVGRMAPEKRIFTLVEMMLWFRNRHENDPNAIFPYLVLIGRGPLDESLKQFHGPENR
jgi:glycosyltransferase involved in cell wall biosynthesis